MPATAASTVARRRAVLGLACVIALAFTVALVAYARSNSRATPNLSTKTAEVRDVTIKVTPIRVAGDDAVFTVSFVSMSSELTFDVPEVARLTVDGQSWTPATWDGAGPGGLSREGRLEFRSLGPARGNAVLRVEILGGSATLTWRL